MVSTRRMRQAEGAAQQVPPVQEAPPVPVVVAPQVNQPNAVGRPAAHDGLAASALVLNILHHNSTGRSLTLRESVNLFNSLPITTELAPSPMFSSTLRKRTLAKTGRVWSKINSTPGVTVDEIKGYFDHVRNEIDVQKLENAVARHIKIELNPVAALQNHLEDAMDTNMHTGSGLLGGEDMHMEGTRVPWFLPGRAPTEYLLQRTNNMVDDMMPVTEGFVDEAFFCMPTSTPPFEVPASDPLACSDHFEKLIYMD